MSSCSRTPETAPRTGAASQPLSTQAPTPRVDPRSGSTSSGRPWTQATRHWQLTLPNLSANSPRVAPALPRGRIVVRVVVAKPTVMLLGLLTTGAVSGYADYPQRLHRLTRPHLTAAQSMHSLARRRTCQADAVRTVAFVPSRARPPQSHATNAVDEEPFPCATSERRRWQLLRQPSCAAG